MIKYVIRFIEDTYYVGGYPIGTYQIHGEVYCGTSNVVIYKVHKYTSKSRAERGAEALIEKCSNLFKYKIEEVRVKE